MVIFFFKIFFIIGILLLVYCYLYKMVRIKKYKSAQNVLVIKSIRFMLNDLINSSVEKYVFLTCQVMITF